MTRAIVNNMFGNAFSDFVYQAVVIALAVASSVAIYVEISRL